MKNRKTTFRRAVAAFAVVAIAFSATTPPSASGWGRKKGERARVELPSSAEMNPDSTPLKGSVVAGVEELPPVDAKGTRRKASAPRDPGAVPSTPPPPAVPEPPKPPTPKKTELEKRREQLRDAQKDYDRKKFKKSLEKATELISELSERGYAKNGSDGKGKDARQFQELLQDATELARKSSERYDEPTIPSGLTGKALYFVF